MNHVPITGEQPISNGKSAVKVTCRSRVTLSTGIHSGPDRILGSYSDHAFDQGAGFPNRRRRMAVLTDEIVPKRD
jgi:hypothetical protein